MTDRSERSRRPRPRAGADPHDGTPTRRDARMRERVSPSGRRRRSRSTGRPFTARKGELVIAAAERAGDVHPALLLAPPDELGRHVPAVPRRGRQRRGPQLTPSCMVTVAPDMKVDTESATTKRAQEGMLELLLANHPLDCPVCDKGGECPLQDQAFSHGPGESRYVEEKRHFEKPIPISDLVLLDRERCILCDRCTRFADEVAGDPLIRFTHRGNQTQVLTFPDEPFSSYFSGNTVQICPVGALTATPYRFKARPWDLEQVESTCTTCSVGCRTVVQSSRDELVRYHGVDSDPVNWGWLCDRGRFNFEAANSDRAPRRAARARRGRPRRDVVERRDDGRRPARPRGARRRWPGQHRRARRRPRHERGRLRLGAARRRPRRRHTATPSSATACRPSCSRCRGRRSTRRPRPPPSCSSDPTSRRSCRSSTSACATPPSSEADQDPRARPGRHRPHPVRLAQRAHRGRRRSARSQPTLAEHEIVDQLARRPGRRRRRAGEPGRVRRGRGGRAARRARRLPGRQGAAGAAARQRRRRPAARAGAAGRRPRRCRHPGGRGRRAASTCSCCSAPTRSPTAPTPTWPAAPSPAPAGCSPSTRS